MDLKGDKSSSWNKTLQNVFSLNCCHTSQGSLPKGALPLLRKYFLQYFGFLFLVLTVGTKQRQTRNLVKANGKVNETAAITGNKSRNGSSKVFLLDF